MDGLMRMIRRGSALLAAFLFVTGLLWSGSESAFAGQQEVQTASAAASETAGEKTIKPADGVMPVNSPFVEDISKLSDSEGTAGVEAELRADRESYRSGQETMLTLAVKNTNDYPVTDISVSYDLPDNFALAEGQSASQQVDSLGEGETKEFAVKAVVTEDPGAEQVEADIPILPIAGAAVVLLLLVLLFFVLRLRKKKRGTRALALFLAGVLGAALPGAIPAQRVLAITPEGLAQEEDFNRVMVHDPSVVKDTESGEYYLFGSHLAFVKSKNLYGWEAFDCNVKRDYEELFKEPWAWAEQGNHGGSNPVNLSGQMWAPDVIYNDTMKKWCMYMSIDGNDWCSSICLLTADKIEGPYKYEGIVVYSGMNNPKSKADLSKTDVYKVLDKDDDLYRYADTNDACINAIDPCVRYDDKGDLYMTYGSWSAGIYILKLDTKTGLRDYGQKYETKQNVSDAYYGIKIAGGFYNSGEGSYILHAGKYYYLFMSYAGLEARRGYQMRVYRSEAITGPYADANGVSAISAKGFDYKITNYGLKIFGSYDIPGLDRVQVAQGHNSAFVDEDGRIYLVYHTRFASANNDQRHNVRVHQLFVNADGWPVAAPFETTGERLPEKIETKDVVGEYAFIYHEPLKYYDVVAGKTLGVVGDADGETTHQITVKKELVVAKRRAVVKASVSFGHHGGELVYLKEDGTVSGDRQGTWKCTDGAAVELELDGVMYKGFFLRQEDELPERNLRMTFTAEGDNLSVWGVQTDKQLGISEESETEGTGNEAD